MLPFVFVLTEVHSKASKKQKKLLKVENAMLLLLFFVKILFIIGVTV
jgi:hypothetical protein